MKTLSNYLIFTLLLGICIPCEAQQIGLYLYLTTQTNQISLGKVSYPPTNQIVVAGETTVISVTVTSSCAGPFAYLWQHDGTNINNIHKITTIAGTGNGGYAGDRGPATNATLLGPIGIRADNAGNLYIADAYNNAIRKISTNGIITTVAGNGVQNYYGDGGLAMNANLNTPWDVCADASGNVYIADTWNHRIRKVDTNGIITTVAGGGETYFPDDNGGQATNAATPEPMGIAVDASGNFYFSEFDNALIRKVDTNGIITTVAGDGDDDYSGDGGSATNSHLSEPMGVVLDNVGNLYIAEHGTDLVRKVDTNGILTTVAGDYSYFSDPNYYGEGGLAIDATFNEISYIALDRFGNLYIADDSNHAVRKVDTNGIISTLAGHGSWNGELALESGLLSSNLNPAGVAIDPSGNLDFSAGFRVCQINFPYLPVSNVPTPSAALILTNVTANDAGTYQLIISSSCGSVTDAVVTLTVIGHFIMTGSMNSPQSGGVAVLLQNGKVLVVAGSSAELYNPTTETWSVTGSLNIPRYYGYTATLLSNGKVLVAGGANNSSSYMANAELYDPATGTWTATGAMNKPRTTHTAVLLPNGKVLVMGGWGESEMDGTQTLSSAELYDPTTGTWTQINSMNSRRFSFPAALLPSGKVLVAGGYDNYNDNPIANAELYDPATGTWSETSSLNEPRDSGLMVMMSTGKALIVGGNDWDPIGSTELYNPATGTWTTTGSLNTTRQGCTATPLPNGWVLVAGGYYYNSPTDKGEFSSAEVYNPDTGAWTATTPMNVARFGHTATLLANGDVLIAGGGGLLWPNGLTSSAELYRQ